MKASNHSFPGRCSLLVLLALVVLSAVGARAQSGHTLVAHYAFDNTGSLGQDTSGSNNNITTFSSTGSCGLVQNTTNSKAGSHAALFNTMSGTCASWFKATNSQVLAAIAGSFSLSLWLKTSDTSGANTDSGFLGEGIATAFNGGSQTIVPMTLNGSKLGFFTGGSPNDTLHSASSINTGQYVHLVVTRNQTNGAKNIYVNGLLDASSTGSTNVLNSPTEMDMGYVSGSGKGIGGQIDDCQLYTGVLSANEVTYLYNNPGLVAPAQLQDFNTALNTTNLNWITSATNGWFVQSATNHDGVSAAQSGVITGSQTTLLQTTVTGPGNLTFWWQTKTTPSDFDFDLEFDIDGFYQDDILNIQSWTQDNFPITAGTHTLTWTAYAGDDTSATGWLDQVSYIPTQNSASPFSLINPQISGVNFQFSFQSQIGFSNTVQYRTNLTGTNWQNYTNLAGDGALKTIQIPVTGTNSQYFRVLAH